MSSTLSLPVIGLVCALALERNREIEFPTLLHDKKQRLVLWGKLAWRLHMKEFLTRRLFDWCGFTLLSNIISWWPVYKTYALVRKTRSMFSRSETRQVALELHYWILLHRSLTITELNSQNPGNCAFTRWLANTSQWILRSRWWYPLCTQTGRAERHVPFRLAS